jgi:hypothetical protein
MAVVSLLAAFGLPAAILGSCGGKLPGPRICSERAPCGAGKTCVLGRCRVEGTSPVSARAPRLSFEPEDIGLMAGDKALPRAELGPAIALGQRDASALLLMRFAVKIPASSRLERALVVLEPLPDCTRRPGRVVIEVAHVLAPWSSADLRHHRVPKMTVPMHAATVSATPARALRLDVTELVREWRAEPERYHGLALLASGDSDTGACYTSGLGWGVGPRLEVYLVPKEEKDAGADAADAAVPDARPPKDGGP